MEPDARQRLLRAAGQVFADKGFEKATVREICDAASVNVASVNYYFRDKERLYLEAVRQAHEARAAQAPFPSWEPGIAAEVRLRRFVRTLMMRMVGLQEEPWQARLMMREMLQPTGACRAMAEEYFRPHFEQLLEILTVLLPAGAPVHETRKLGFSVIGQCLYYRVAGPIIEMLTPADELERHFSLDELTESVFRFTMGAISSWGPAAGTSRRLSAAACRVAEEAEHESKT